PPETTDPESTMIMLEPRLWICSATRAWAPEPPATMVMTAPTPITMPSMVRALRSLLTRRARTAIRALAHALLHTPKASSAVRAGSARHLLTGRSPRASERVSARLIDEPTRAPVDPGAVDRASVCQQFAGFVRLDR